MSAVKPKKQLGQHFLKDKSIALRIVEAYVSEQRTDNTIEIGPGTGVLTDLLLEQDLPGFQAQDVDRESIAYLHKKHPQHTEKLLYSDFLAANLSLLEGSLGIIGNFPYNISSQIFFRVYENHERTELVVGMLQKEVAERICAGPGSKTYGILSVLLQTYYNTSYLFTVPPHVFDPPPKVQSAVIRLVRNDRRKPDFNTKLFKTVVKEGFQKRRKTLRNALKSLSLSAELEELPWAAKRAEQLSVEDFIELTRLIEDDRANP